MLEVIDMFIKNDCKYNDNIGKQLEKLLDKVYNIDDFSTILLIIGEKALFENDMILSQYIASIIYKLNENEELFISKETLSFLEKVEKDSAEEYKNKKINMKISGVIVSFILAMVLLYFFDLSLGRAGLFFVVMLLIDSILTNINIKKIFNNYILNELSNEKYNKYIKFVEKNMG